jgi:hypothetical protein
LSTSGIGAPRFRFPTREVVCLEVNLCAKGSKPARHPLFEKNVAKNQEGTLGKIPVLF